MSQIRTFIDAGVLIAAAQGNSELSERAMNILEDPEREFVSSPFVQLEVLPKAKYHKNEEEAEFYETFFNEIKIWVNSLEQVVESAHQHAYDLGLSAVDALHVSAAMSVASDELVTTEKSGRPLH